MPSARLRPVVVLRQRQQLEPRGPAVVRQEPRRPRRWTRWCCWRRRRLAAHAVSRARPLLPEQLSRLRQQLLRVPRRRPLLLRLPAYRAPDGWSRTTR